MLDFGSFDYHEAITTVFRETNCQIFTEANASVASCSYVPVIRGHGFRLSNSSNRIEPGPVHNIWLASTARAMSLMTAAIAVSVLMDFHSHSLPFPRTNSHYSSRCCYIHSHSSRFSISNSRYLRWQFPNIIIHNGGHNLQTLYKLHTSQHHLSTHSMTIWKIYTLPHSFRFVQVGHITTAIPIPIFIALNGMQTRSSDEISVCLSVRLSDKRVHCDKTEEKSLQIFTPCERSFSQVFWEEKWWVWGDPFYLKFWVNRPPLERNRRFWTNNRS